MTDPFAPLTTPPLDPLFKLYGEYLADSRPEKVNLGIGIYTDPRGRPFVFPSIQQAAKCQPTDNFNYDPIRGNADFLRLASELVLGDDAMNTAAQQSVGGTHAVSLFGALARGAGYRHLAIGTPTWGNHLALFGGYDIHEFDHLDASGEPDIAAYEAAIRTAPEGSVLLIHGGPTHNPTGKNIAASEIVRLAPEINARGIFVFIDAAYLGFGNGLNEDIAEIRAIFAAVDRIAIGVSFSKNASMYRHRLGALFMKTTDAEKVEALMQTLVRESISMPPGFGSSVMVDVLMNARDAWAAELDSARRDIDSRRTSLIAQLPATFHHLKNCRGLFGLIGLSREQIDRLRDEYAIYIPNSSRVNFGGMEVERIDYVADCIRRVTR